MNPIISIIVPVYNVEPYLKGCIDSILAQSFSSFEVILVNDGSDDKSGVICDEYQRKDARVRVIHKEYGGVSSARNVGVSSARGQYIGFVDGDDRIERDMYTILYELCVETNSDISICKLGREIDGKLINNNSERIFIKEMEHIEGLKELFKGELFRFSLCNKLFKKSCFHQIQFPMGRIHEDLATTYKLFANADKTIFANYIGYIYIKRENSILTSKFSSERLDAFLAWDEILTFMKEKYKQLYRGVMFCFVYWSVDNVYYILGQVKTKEDRMEYLYTVKAYISKYFNDIINNKKLSFKYKYTITLLRYNTRLLLLSNKIKSIVSFGKI
ncbi:glycosyltransferase [Robertmurraya yapensis]|uniref:Glycosyltransferase n=2 Tax=Bacillaceae TaxID=186817 RepID=A0A431W3H0_9BACI|nr:glycosyltransferase [Bacillus yapensis]RTR30006.1 glycosyltransferase [Bacillus yapensis]TKS95087.1 glycosyltransferase [Bacillus yapensis]